MLALLPKAFDAAPAAAPARCGCCAGWRGSAAREFAWALLVATLVAVAVAALVPLGALGGSLGIAIVVALGVAALRLGRLCLAEPHAAPARCARRSPSSSRPRTSARSALPAQPAASCRR